MILSFFTGKSCVVLQDVPVLFTSFPITLHTVWSVASHEQGPLWNTLQAEPVRYSIHTKFGLCNWHTDRIITLPILHTLQPESTVPLIAAVSETWKGIPSPIELVTENEKKMLVH